MNDSTCPRPCLMKLDLQSSTNKLAFLKDNWPSFGQIESIDRLSETELRCTLCLLDVVLAALAKDECFCPNREIILQSPNQKIPDRKTKCVIKTHINIKQNVIFGAKLKPV